MARGAAAVAHGQAKIGNTHGGDGVGQAIGAAGGAMGRGEGQPPHHLLDPRRARDEAMKVLRPGVHHVHHRLAPPPLTETAGDGGGLDGRPGGQHQVGLGQRADLDGGDGHPLPGGGVAAMAPRAAQPDVVAIGQRGDQADVKPLGRAVDGLQPPRPLGGVREVAAPPNHAMPGLRQRAAEQVVALRPPPLAGEVVEGVVDPDLHHHSFSGARTRSVSWARRRRSG